MQCKRHIELLCPTGQPSIRQSRANPISGAGSWSLDASIFRTFSFSERYQVQLRGEAFGIANTPIWNNPDRSINDSAFGYVTSAGGNRTIQLGAKVIF